MKSWFLFPFVPSSHPPHPPIPTVVQCRPVPFRPVLEGDGDGWDIAFCWHSDASTLWCWGGGGQGTRHGVTTNQGSQVEYSSVYVCVCVCMCVGVLEFDDAWMRRFDGFTTVLQYW